MAQNCLEMSEFFARQTCERNLQRFQMRVAKEQPDGGRGRLLFAMRVVDQNLFHLERGPVDPGAIGCGCQIQHRVVSAFMSTSYLVGSGVTTFSGATISISSTSKISVAPG